MQAGWIDERENEMTCECAACLAQRAAGQPYTDHGGIPRPELIEEYRRRFAAAEPGQRPSDYNIASIVDYVTDKR